MSAEHVFARVRRALEESGVPYMVTGSFASSLYGESRASKDIDIVIAPTRDQLLALVREFSPDSYYASNEDALNAFDHSGMFNVIDHASGWKIDFIVRKRRPFSETEFARRREQDFGGIHMFVATAEDTVIAKLEWAKLGESLREIDDAAGILRLRGTSLDLEYIERWVAELGLGEEWRQAKTTAEGREFKR